MVSEHVYFLATYGYGLAMHSRGFWREKRYGQLEERYGGKNEDMAGRKDTYFVPSNFHLETPALLSLLLWSSWLLPWGK